MAKPHADRRASIYDSGKAPKQMSSVPSIFQMLREHRFDDVVPVVSQTLRAAASESPQRLKEVAQEIVRWQGISKSNAQAMTSETYFRTVFALLQELAGPESSS